MKTFGKYEILDEVGRGGFGIVYKARDTKLNRMAAVKVLKPLLVEDPMFVARFQQEAQSVASLKHPNIVTIYELGEEQGAQYIAMEFLEGASLAKIISEAGPMSLERASTIIAQVASALDYAHRKGLIHRDVKPSNIIIGDDDHATLTDFGLVKAESGSGLSTGSQFLGSAEYMAPEQAQGKPVDARTDVYALGIVLFEMLTGKVPFQADTTLATLFKQVNDPPPSIRELRGDLPQSIEGVVEKALAKSPDARYQTCSELSNASWQTAARVAEKSAQLARSSLGLKMPVGSGSLERRIIHEPQRESSPSLAEKATLPEAPRPSVVATSNGQWKNRIMIGFGAVALGLLVCCTVIALRVFSQSGSSIDTQAQLISTKTVSPVATFPAQPSPKPIIIVVTATAAPATVTPTLTATPRPTPTRTVTPEPTPSAIVDRELYYSKHTDKTSIAWTQPVGMANQSCVRCHSGAGFESFLKDPQSPSSWDISAQTLSCSDCHDPNSTNKSFGLRSVGKPVGLLFEAKDIGLSATCWECHNANLVPGDALKGGIPHDDSAGEFLSDTGGVTYGNIVPNSPHGLLVGVAPIPNPIYAQDQTTNQFLFSKAGDTKGNIPGPCVTCHMYPGLTDTNDPNHAKFGGHSFNTVSLDGTFDYSAACKSCHGLLTDFNFRAKADYDANGRVDGVQDEVKGLLNVLWKALVDKGTKRVDSGFPYATLPMDPDGNVNPKILNAWYNFRTVYGTMWSADNPGNQGKAQAIHNFKRSVALLQLSIRDLNGSLPAGMADGTK